ncbi:hypothetical protein VTL71DRAFT_6124 [Oculimacula yallundae]|uniref:Uncharacterized protein n=1 Tax=Oculimacula yallundae TaxID=86028 RepID=A0ABR4BZK0_9HELO
MPSGNDHAHPTHFGGFAGIQDPHFSMSPTNNPSPAFAPHAFLHNGLQSPGFASSSGSRQQGMFTDAALGRLDSVALGASGNDSPLRDAFVGGSGNVSRMFDELTNQEDGDELGPKGEKRSSIADKDNEAANWDADDGMDMFLDGP